MFRSGSRSASLIFVMLAAASPAFAAPTVAAPSAAPAAKQVGVLMSYAGTVRYWGQVVRGPTPVVEGSFIETGKDSNCSLLIGREGVVHIGPESRLELQSVQVEQLKRAQLNFMGRDDFAAKGEPNLGVYCDVVEPGVIRLGDAVAPV